MEEGDETHLEHHTRLLALSLFSSHNVNRTELWDLVLDAHKCCKVAEVVSASLNLTHNIEHNYV